MFYVWAATDQMDVVKRWCWWWCWCWWQKKWLITMEVRDVPPFFFFLFFFFILFLLWQNSHKTFKIVWTTPVKWNIIHNKWKITNTLTFTIKKEEKENWGKIKRFSFSYVIWLSVIFVQFKSFISPWLWIFNNWNNFIIYYWRRKFVVFDYFII